MAGFELDSGFEKAFLRSEAVEGVLVEVANMSASQAKKITRHPTIRAGIKVVSGIEGGVAVARVIATDFKSHWFEFGTVKMRAEPYLSTSVMAIGLRLEGARNG